MLTALLLVLGQLHAPPHPVAMPAPSGPIYSQVQADQSAFRLLPPSGAGIPYATSTFCSDFASELTGNYFCMNGDGTQAPGGLTLTPTGSPSTVTPRVCPNGPDCGAMSAYSMNGTSQHFTAANATHAGNFSACILYRADKGPSVNTLITGGSVSTNYWQLYSTNTEQIGDFVAGGAPVTTIGTVGGGPRTGIHLGCVTYQRVGGAADNIYKQYRDGVLEDTKSTAALWPTSAQPIKVAIDYSGTTNRLEGHLYAVLYTDKLLDPTTIQNMANALLPTLRGTRGEAITFTRNSTATVPAPDGTLVTVPSGRMRVSSWPGFPSLLVEGSGTNLVFRSEEFDNGSWTKMGTTISANNTASPRGVVDAERLTATATTDGHGVHQGSLSVTSGTTYAASAFGKFGSGFPYMGIVFSDGESTGACAFDIQNGVLDTCSGLLTPTALRIESAANGFYRGSASFVSSVTGSAASVAVQFCDTAARCQSGSWLAAGTEYAFLFGAQVEASPFATSYIRTEGTAVTRAAENMSLSTPATVTDSAGCAGASVFVDHVWLGSALRPIAFTGAISPFQMNTNDVSAYDGTNSPSSSFSSTAANRRVTGIGSWSIALNQLRARSGENADGTTAFDSAIVGPTTYLGSIGGSSNHVFGWLGNIRLGATTTACDR